jgi:long-chain acyl-CoA synthetase
MFEISVRRYPDNKCFTAFVPKKVTFTYTEVHQQVLKVANYLASKKVGKGTKVAVSGKNSPEWAIAYLGILLAEPSWSRSDNTLSNKDMVKLMDFAGAKILFADPERLENFDTRKQAWVD